jgi:hypothetical protein
LAVASLDAESKNTLEGKAASATKMHFFFFHEIVHD